MTIGTEQFFDTWKRQVEASVRIMDAVVEATAKMRTTQLAAANQTRERVQALQKALMDAKNAQEMWGAQWNWAMASCGHSAAYWRSLFEAMTEANSRLGHCVQDGLKSALPAQDGDSADSAGFTAVDNVYREMLKTSQQLMQYGANAFNAPGMTFAAKPEGKGESQKAA